MTYRILIAEDDAIARRDLREILEAMGHDVVGEARGGAQVVELAKSESPDLVILDAMMPGMSGLEAAEALAARYPTIMISAHSDGKFVARARDAGVMAYLGKPFRSQDIGPSIEVAVASFVRRSDLSQQVERLNEKLQARQLIERAKGLLMDRDQLSEADAYKRMQSLSMERNIPLRQVAEAVILALDS